MDEGFVKFLVYLAVFCSLGLFWDNFKGDTVNKKSAYVGNSYKPQVQSYRQNQDFHRGVPVNVYR